MKTAVIKQEILLMITPFSKNALSEKDAPRAVNQSYAEQLEEACWNGLFDELLNGIVKKTSSGKRLCIWSIHREKSFLEIELCDNPQFTERYLSIDPYRFFPMLLQN